MLGMNRTTGGAIDGAQHLAQSITDILTTPIGSRVMRRDYGSEIPALIDAPFSAHTRIRLYAATASALMRWEPRLQLTRVGMAPGDSPGAVVVTVEGTRTDTPVPTRTHVTVPLNPAAA